MWITTDWRGKRPFVHRKESFATTWRFRLGVFVCCGLLVALTRGLWIPALGRDLVCTEQLGSVDAILVENLERNYHAFERAVELRNAGFSRRVMVPTQASEDQDTLDPVSEGIVGVMARVASLQDYEIIPIRQLEPITLNAAYQIRDYAVRKNIRSIIVVTPAFRSRRSLLIYESVLGGAGLAVRCAPVFSQRTVDTWAESWHGIMEVGEQLLKLQYYRFCVLPFVLREDGRS